MMIVMKPRPNGYKLGLVTLAAGFVFYVVGFSSPFWTTYKMSFHVLPAAPDHTANDHDYYYDNAIHDQPLPFVEMWGHDGLWRSCSSTEQLGRVCVGFDHGGGPPGWIMATQGLQCVGLIALVLALVYAVAANLLQAAPAFLKITEVLAAVGSGLGFVGCVVFAAEIQQDNGQTEEGLRGHAQLQDVTVDFNHLAWAFGVDITGCLLALVGTALVARYNRPDKQDTGCVARASFTGTNINPAGGAPSVAVSMGTQPVMTDGGAVAVPAAAAAAATSTAPGTHLYFIHPQRVAGGFCPPPYDPCQSGHHHLQGATGGRRGSDPEVCFDNLALAKGDKL